MPWFGRGLEGTRPNEYGTAVGGEEVGEKMKVYESRKERRRTREERRQVELGEREREG